MKLKKIIGLMLFLCSILGCIWCWYITAANVEYVAGTEIEVSAKELNKITKTLYDVDMINVRIKGAVRKMGEARFQTTLIERYIKEKPLYTEDKVRELLSRVSVKQKSDSEKGLVWVIQAVAENKDEAMDITTFYVDNLSEYFRNESITREEKIVAWFNQEIYHHQRQNKSVELLIKRKQEVLKNEKAQCIIIEKTKSYILKRKK
jgi:hypothetical protein